MRPDEASDDARATSGQTRNQYATGPDENGPNGAKRRDVGTEIEMGKRRPTAAGKEKTDGGHEDGGCGGRRNPTRSDTMLGIDKLYSIGAKGHRYSTCTGVQICRKPPNKWGNYNIQTYI
jgi:hypothetical protein